MSNLRINGIPGSTCNLRHNHTILPDQTIDDGGFTHIRFTDDGNLDTVIFFLLCRFSIKIRYHLIQKFPEPQTVYRRNRIGLPDAQIIKLIDIRHIFFKIIYLIDCQYYRFPGTSKHVRHLGIRILQPLFHIHKKEDHIRCVDGNLRLLPHLRKNNILTLRLYTTGINQGKVTGKPSDICIDSVSGNTRSIFYDRYIFTCQSIEQCGLSYIGTPHHRHDRLGLFLTHSFLHNSQRYRLILQHLHSLVKFLSALILLEIP